MVVAGHNRPAHRRAVAWAHGWCGHSLTPGDVTDAIAGLRRAADHVDRPVELGELEISVTPRGQLTAERVAAYAEVHRLVMLPPPTPDGPARTIKAAVTAVGDV